MKDRESSGRHAALFDFPVTQATEEMIWREAQWGGMRVGYETYLEDFSDEEMLKGLPGDRCQCPHWGYLIAGRMTVKYADRDDVVKAGEAYYMAPGHTIAVEAGTVLVEFSPWDEFRTLMEFAERKMAQTKGKNTSR